MNHEQHDRQPVGPGRGRIALALVLAVAAFFLLSEHQAHVLGFLPYLLVIACPLMHLLHHGGHGSHGSHGGESRRAGDAPPTERRP